MPGWMLDATKSSWSAITRVFKGPEEAFLAEIARDLHGITLQDISRKDRDCNMNYVR